MLLITIPILILLLRASTNARSFSNGGDTDILVSPTLNHTIYLTDSETQCQDVTGQGLDLEYTSAQNFILSLTYTQKSINCTNPYSLIHTTARVFVNQSENNLRIPMNTHFPDSDLHLGYKLEIHAHSTLLIRSLNIVSMPLNGPTLSNKIHHFHQLLDLQVAFGVTKLKLHENTYIDDLFLFFMEKVNLNSWGKSKINWDLFKKKFAVYFYTRDKDARLNLRLFFSNAFNCLLRPDCVSTPAHHPSFHDLFEYTDQSRALINIKPIPFSLFGQPQHLDYFRFIGRMIGVAIQYKQTVNMQLCTAVYKGILDRDIGLVDLLHIDPALYEWLESVLNRDVTPLRLTMSDKMILDGTITTFDLVHNGRKVLVTNHNKLEYVQLLIQARYTKYYHEQMAALRQGVYDFVSATMLNQMSAWELELIINGQSAIHLSHWRSYTKYGSLYHDTHPVVVWFWDLLASWSQPQLGRLLYLVTGTSKVPVISGFRNLHGIGFTIIRMKSASRHVDQYSPIPHLEIQILEMPEYTSFQALKHQLERLILV